MANDIGHPFALVAVIISGLPTKDLGQLSVITAVLSPYIPANLMFIILMGIRIIIRQQTWKRYVQIAID